MKRLLTVGALLLTVGGCQSLAPATIAGECRLFTDPGFAVQGARLKDKQWIGTSQEIGIRACGWIRPKS